MKLQKFLRKYTRPNSVFRLWYPVEGGHQTIKQNIDAVEDNHQIDNPTSKYFDYRKHKVLGVTDIVVEGRYPEAINIIIEKKQNT